MVNRTIILATLEATYWKVKISLDEIKQNRPDRIDLINSMENTLTDLFEIRNFVHKDEEFISTLMKSLSETKLENLKLKSKCYELESKLNNLVNSVEL